MSYRHLIAGAVFSLYRDLVLPDTDLCIFAMLPPLLRNRLAGSRSLPD